MPWCFRSIRSYYIHIQYTIYADARIGNGFVEIVLPSKVQCFLTAAVRERETTSVAKPIARGYVHNIMLERAFPIISPNAALLEGFYFFARTKEKNSASAEVVKSHRRSLVVLRYSCAVCAQGVSESSDPLQNSSATPCYTLYTDVLCTCCRWFWSAAYGQSPRM